MLMLSLYIFGSLAAIGLIALLIHRLGHSAPRLLDDEAAVRAAFAAEFPDHIADHAIGHIDLSVDRTAALIHLQADEQAGLVRAMGRYLVVRLVAPREVAAARCKGPLLHLSLKDYADPSLAIEFASEAIAAEWQARLSPPVPPQPARPSNMTTHA